MLYIIAAIGFLSPVMLSLLWVWGDAEDRGKPGIAVALLVAFTWPIGLLVWIVFRPETTIQKMQ